MLDNLRIGQRGNWHAIVCIIVRVAWSVEIVASGVLWLWGLRLDGFCRIAITGATVSMPLYFSVSVSQAVHQRPAREHNTRYRVWLYLGSTTSDISQSRDSTYLNLLICQRSSSFSALGSCIRWRRRRNSYLSAGQSPWQGSKSPKTAHKELLMRLHHI